jgi:2',3'-cyclic-nucleotide 2'-phosphodiesterase/3'-nucleotidase
MMENQAYNGRAWLRNQSYNFDSAAGLDYLVDVSRPEGKMVIIKSLSDGRLRQAGILQRCFKLLSW